MIKTWPSYGSIKKIFVVLGSLTLDYFNLSNYFSLSLFCSLSAHRLRDRKLLFLPAIIQLTDVLPDLPFFLFILSPADTGHLNNRLPLVYYRNNLGRTKYRVAQYVLARLFGTDQRLCCAAVRTRRAHSYIMIIPFVGPLHALHALSHLGRRRLSILRTQSLVCISLLGLTLCLVSLAHFQNRVLLTDSSYLLFSYYFYFN